LKQSLEKLHEKIQALEEKEEKYKKAIHDYQERETKYKKILEQNRLTELREPAVLVHANGLSASAGSFSSFFKPYHTIQPVPFNPFKNMS